MLAAAGQWSRRSRRTISGIPRRRCIASLLLGWLLVASTTLSASAVAAAAVEDKQRVIVQLTQAVSLEQAVAEERRRGGRIRHTYRHVLTGFAADLAPQRIAALRDDPTVATITQTRGLSQRGHSRHLPGG